MAIDHQLEELMSHLGLFVFIVTLSRKKSENERKKKSMKMFPCTKIQWIKIKVEVN